MPEDETPETAPEPSFTDRFLNEETKQRMLRAVELFIDELRIEYMGLFDKPWHTCRDRVEGDMEMSQLAAFAMFMGTMPKSVHRPFSKALAEREEATPEQVKEFEARLREQSADADAQTRRSRNDVN